MLSLFVPYVILEYDRNLRGGLFFSLFFKFLLKRQRIENRLGKGLVWQILGGGRELTLEMYD